MKNSKFLKIIICALVIILILLITIFKVWNDLQDDVFFHPWHDVQAYEQLQNLKEFNEIKIKNKDVQLSGWLWNIQNTNEKAPLVVFFTGNAQNSSNTMYNYYQNEQIKKAFGKYNLLIVDYPGYGLSKGKPAEKSMFLASKYIFDYATQLENVDTNNIVIMGFSIGTGVASYCASENDANVLILVAPYDNALSLYNDAVNSFHGPVKKITKYNFASDDYAEKIIEPTLIITSKEDEAISYTHSINLSKHFKNLKNIVVLEDSDHNGYFLRDDVLTEISNFLEDNIKN